MPSRIQAWFKLGHVKLKLLLSKVKFCISFIVLREAEIFEENIFALSTNATTQYPPFFSFCSLKVLTDLSRRSVLWFLWVTFIAQLHVFLLRYP